MPGAGRSPILQAMQLRKRPSNLTAPATEALADRDIGVWVSAGLGAISGLLLGVSLFAPAVWLYPVIRDWTNGHVLLENCEGTVWQGSARLILAGGAGSHDAAVLPGRVQWNVTLHRDFAEMAFHADCCTTDAQRLRIFPSLQSWTATLLPAESTWPSTVLAGFGAPWNSVQLDGALHLTSPGLSLTSTASRFTLAGAMTLQAIDMRSRLSGTLPMGTYQLDLRGGLRPVLQLNTVQGSLQLNGSGFWSGSRLHMQVMGKSNDSQRTELTDLLNFLGQHEGMLSFDIPA